LKKKKSEEIDESSPDVERKDKKKEKEKDKEKEKEKEKEEKEEKKEKKFAFSPTKSRKERNSISIDDISKMGQGDDPLKRSNSPPTRLGDDYVKANQSSPSLRRMASDLSSFKDLQLSPGEKKRSLKRQLSADSRKSLVDHNHTIFEEKEKEKKKEEKKEDKKEEKKEKEEKEVVRPSSPPIFVNPSSSPTISSSLPISSSLKGSHSSNSSDAKPSTSPPKATLSKRRFTEGSGDSSHIVLQPRGKMQRGKSNEDREGGGKEDEKEKEKTRGGVERSNSNDDTSSTGDDE